MLTPDFGKIQIAMKMVLSERVFSMKIFTSPSGTTLMFRLYSFDFILRTETILRVVFGQSRLQDDLGRRSTVKELSSSRRGNRF